MQVFPRVGLKAFTALPPDDKTAQLHELSNIVSGIRLFNRHIGKGGAGISDLPTTCAELVAALINKVAAELESVETLCAQYVDVIAHQYRAASGAGTRGFSSSSRIGGSTPRVSRSSTVRSSSPVSTSSSWRASSSRDGCAEGARRLARVGTEGAGVPAIRLSRETVGFL